MSGLSQRIARLDRPPRLTGGMASRRPQAEALCSIRSQRRLRGRCMAYVRRLSAAQKNQVRKEKGWQAAIRMAAGMAKAR
jgi:hypothetical protein